jgi:hypothetical protein
MRQVTFDELTPEEQARFGPGIELMRAKTAAAEGPAATLPPPPAARPEPDASPLPEPPPPPAPAVPTRPYRPYRIPELGEEVLVTYADLNDGIFIARHAPKDDPGDIQGFILQIIRCVYREPGVRRFRFDSVQDDRAFLRETLSFETLVDLMNISSLLGRRQEYLSEGVRNFFTAIQTFFAALSGHSSTCTSYPMELREQQTALMSAAFALTSAIPSSSGIASDGAE